MFAVRRGVLLLTSGILLSGFMAETSFAKDNSSGPGAAAAFCNARRCKNECVDAYPGGGGPLSTCRKLCDLSPTCGDKLNASQGMAKSKHPNTNPKAATPK